MSAFQPKAIYRFTIFGWVRIFVRSSFPFVPDLLNFMLFTFHLPVHIKYCTVRYFIFFLLDLYRNLSTFIYGIFSVYRPVVWIWLLTSFRLINLTPWTTETLIDRFIYSKLIEWFRVSVGSIIQCLPTLKINISYHDLQIGPHTR